MFANAHAGDGGRDGAVLTADLGGCLRFRVEGVEMARPAVKEDEDARADPGRPVGPAERGKRQPGGRGSQEFTAIGRATHARSRGVHQKQNPFTQRVAAKSGKVKPPGLLCVPTCELCAYGLTLLGFHSFMEVWALDKDGKTIGDPTVHKGTTTTGNPGSWQVVTLKVYDKTKCPPVEQSFVGFPPGKYKLKVQTKIKETENGAQRDAYVETTIDIPPRCGCESGQDEHALKEKAIWFYLTRWESFVVW